MKNNSFGLVSIVMPSFNSEAYILKTIKSVQQQTYQDWELIIIDDRSIDNTVSIIKSIQESEKRLKLIENKENKGAGFSRNQGLKASQGKFISFLDSDDVWKPEKLETQLLFMEKNSYSFTFTSYNRVFEDGKRIKVPVIKKVNYKKLLYSNIIGCSTVIYNKEKIGLFLFPDLRKRQDYALWLSMLKTVDYAYGLNQALTDYSVRKDSISGNKLKASLHTWNVYYNVEKLSWIKSAYYFLSYFLQGVFKSLKGKLFRKQVV